MANPTPPGGSGEKSPILSSAKLEKKPKRWNVRSLMLYILFGLAAFGVFLGVGLVLTGLYFMTQYSEGLPDITTLQEYKPSLVTKLYDNRNKVFAEFFIEKRILLPLESIPLKVIQATIAVEDRNFYSHLGIDVVGITRAALANVKAGEVTQGGSTITQQVAKALFLSPERKLERKLKEALLALRIEQEFSKDEILEIYLNQIYFGHGAYGIEAAARTYFGKSVKDLTVGETALLAGLPRAPKYYSPYFTESGAKRRRLHVLRRMLEENFITSQQFRYYNEETIQLAGLESPKNDAPYFAEHVRRFLETEFGSSSLYRGGLEVYTTVDLGMQLAASESLKTGLLKIDKRLGYRGPLRRIFYEPVESDSPDEPSPAAILTDIDETEISKGFLLARVAEVHPEYAVVVQAGQKVGRIETQDLSWASPTHPRSDALYKRPIKDATEVLQIGDQILVSEKSTPKNQPLSSFRLEQEPDIQGAILSMDPKTGQVLSMMGGYDFDKSEFNRSVQALRQPGSAFKPVIYAAAFEKGFTPSDIIIDSPIIYDETVREFDTWKPVNFDQKFYGPTTLRTALTHSRNIVTIKLLKQVGVSNVVEYGKTLGFQSQLTPDLSLALGSSSLTLLELVRVYGVFANAGIQVEPLFIDMILNRDGTVLLKNEITAKRVIRPEIAYQTTSVLKNVVREGTGRLVRQLRKPIAGKTGTTNDFVDAWFLGYTPNLVTGVWVGRDQRQIIGRNETGSRAAAPIWLEYMKGVLREIPVYDFEVPENVVFVRVDSETGLLASADSKKAVFECFLDGTEPRERFVSGKNGSTPKKF